MMRRALASVILTFLIHLPMLFRLLWPKTAPGASGGLVGRETFLLIRARRRRGRVCFWAVCWGF